MKRDNRGMSLVELIIVMAILAVLSGVMILGISLISGKPAEVCANKLVSALASDRMTAMGSMSARLAIYKDAEGRIWVKETVTELDGSERDAVPVQVGDAGVTVRYRITGDPDIGSSGNSGRDLGDSSAPLVISFDRSTGAFNDLAYGDHMGTGLEGKYCVEIICHKAGTTKVIKLSYLTGKVSMQ